MALLEGRQGYIGLGIETTPGTTVAATTVLPFMTNTIMGKHEPTLDIAARGSRALNYTSIQGKRWGEGDLEVNVDTLNIGFIFKLATGTEATSTPGAGVTDHLFYTTVSGNTPLTATLYQYQGIDVQKYASMALDKVDLEVKDGLMTAKTTFKGLFPTTGSNTNQTVSGTLLNFTDYTLKFGSTLTLAAAASFTPVTDFLMTINNNAEVIFENSTTTASTGSATRVFWKSLEVTGAFTRFFESQTERDNYYNLNKQSIIMTASGTGLPSALNETLTINLAKCAYVDQSVETGIDNFYAIKTTFKAEVDQVQGKQYDITLRNYRSAAYT